MPTDIEIAQNTPIKRITEVAAGLGIPDSSLVPYGHYKAKISLDHLNSLPRRAGSRLILVTAISPTPAGEGKTTAVVGLGDALNRIGKQAIICLREPSMGPVFGIKGGAAGGGHAQVVPMEDINLHFTGDFSAIGLAHNLLAAAIDNHIHQGNALDIDPTRITWKRVLDMNDRALRSIVVGLGGHANGQPREDGFDIVVASEVMAIFCLCTSLMDLRERLGRIVFGYNRQGQPLRAEQLQVHGAMTALLKDAIQPNLVQTLEHNPAIVHGGPFANIAHGCNSVIATRAGLKLADYVVTEAGFGADLGAEKFLDIKCRHAGIWPDACVLVATIRALKYHGGVDVKALNTENLDALSAGIVNLERHVHNMSREFGLPVVVALNRFTADTEAELALVAERMAALGVKVVLADHWARGGKGAEALAHAVVELIDEAAQAPGRVARQGGAVPEQAGGPQEGTLQPPAARPATSASGASSSQPVTAQPPAGGGPLYPDEMPLWDKIVTVARRVYGAAEVVAPSRVRRQIDVWQNAGHGHFPVCIAKTQSSFSTDPTRRGAPTAHTVDIREVRLSAGAGFIVAICGELMTMPGLPRAPAAMNIDVTPEGRITGLF